MPVYDTYQSSSPSLKNISPDIKQDIAEEPAENILVSKERNPFTKEQLFEAWLNFSKSIEKEMPRVFQMFKANDPELKEEYKIDLKLENQSQIKLYDDKVKLKLIGYLRSTLKNGLIDVNVSIGKTEQKKNLVYTNTDKFQYLLELNDKLALMKQKFGLDFE